MPNNFSRPIKEDRDRTRKSTSSSCLLPLLLPTSWENPLDIEFDEDIESNKGDYVMNIEWDYNYYQPWSDNEWLVDEMLAMLDEDVMMQ